MSVCKSSRQNFNAKFLQVINPKDFENALWASSVGQTCLVATMRCLTHEKQRRDDTSVVKFLELLSGGLQQYPGSCKNNVYVFSGLQHVHLMQ